MALIYKNPITVICTNARNSTKIVKGASYLATCVRLDYNRNKYVSIKNLGSYSASNFTLEDHTPLSSVPEFDLERQEMLDPKATNYKGQFVKCRYSSGKTLKEGEIYYVEDQFETVTRSNYNGTSYSDFKLKIRGIKNKVNTYNFYQINITEQRSIKLKNLKGDKIKTGEQTRKFLLYTEIEKTAILFDLLGRVVIDISKIENLSTNKIDIIELILKKGSKYALIREDIDDFLKSKIDILLKNLMK